MECNISLTMLALQKVSVSCKYKSSQKFMATVSRFLGVFHCVIKPYFLYMVQPYYLSLSRLESCCFLATFREMLVPSSGKCEVKCGIFVRRAMVDQAREGLCYQRINLMFLICLT